MSSCILVQLHAKLYILLSSAKTLQQLSTHSGKSLIKLVNSTGPSTLPWGYHSLGQPLLTSPFPSLPFDFYLQRPCYNEQVRAKIQQAIGPHKETTVVWSCFPFIRSGQNHFARHSERGKKTRRTKEEVGRHQGMDRPRVRQIPEGSGEQGKMEKTECEVVCAAPTTLTVKGLMMMMMMLW